MRGRAAAERMVIKRKRRLPWLFRRASFYFIYLSLRSTFGRNLQIWNRSKVTLFTQCSFFPSHFHKQALVFCFDSSRPSAHLFISDVFLRMRETERQRDRDRDGGKVRDKYGVCDHCEQVLRVRIEE